MTKQLLARWGLKWSPFAPDVPPEALFVPPAVEHFYWKIEQGLVRDGGFALVTGDPGLGKSVVLRLLADRLAAVPDLTVGAFTHPQSNLADFYRELGALFTCPLKPHNRWGGFQALREKWQTHLDTTLLRPVLLVDEAQEMSAAALSELRLLTSTRFDSRLILSVVLAGDGRLVERLAQPDLLSLGSRIRSRLALEPLSREELRAHLTHLLATAGNAGLMTPQLQDTLCEHALGNLRVLANLGAELLAVAAQRELPQLDEKLYLELFTAPRRALARRRWGAADPRRRWPVHLDPLLLPDDWTPDQAFAVAEFLIALHDAIWEGYGRAFPDTRSGPPPPVLPVPRQLALPLGDPGDRSH